MKTNKCVIAKGEIHLLVPIEKAFDFLADFTKDKFWRKEINQTCIIESHHGIGTIIEEDTKLSSRVPSNKLVFICTKFDKPYKVVYETISTAPFYTKNSRELVKTSAQTCKFHYIVEFDAAIIAYGLGFNLPSWITALFLRFTVRKYLKQFKSLIENQT